MGKKQKKEEPPKKLGNLVLDLAQLKWLQMALNANRQPDDPRALANLNALSKALRSIKGVARDDGLTDKPKVLVKIGDQLNNIVPKGYENSWNPPLTVKQLKKFLSDPTAAEYVRTKHPGTIGPDTLKYMQTIVDACL